MKKVFFPGSFNPFTKGHADIVERMLSLADKVVIGVGVNTRKPESETVAAENMALILDLYSSAEYVDRVDVVRYSGLTMEAARDLDADCVVRGVRNASDFDYEYALAAANKKVFGIETILLPADPSLSCVSSSVVRDLLLHGREDLADEFLPKKFKN